jgi:signal transduction histidine kinase
MFSLVSGKSGFHDFSLSRRAGNQTESLDLKIFACPVQIKGERFFFFTITDVSHEKRVASLERIFYHDILNTAGGLRELASLLRNEQIEQDKEVLDMFYLYSDYLVQEIEAQKILKAAERNDLQAVPKQIRSFQVLNDIVRLYLHHPVAKDKQLEIVPSSEDITFTSDKNLLARVIGNMIKNALEASKPGDSVTAGCRESGEEIEFWVRNPSVMPEKVQLQVFQRSFSTKGAGRGLGTYGMKLLSERYLKGCVNFSSDESGTVFRAAYPKKLVISNPETESYEPLCD